MMKVRTKITILPLEEDDGLENCQKGEFRRLLLYEFVSLTIRFIFNHAADFLMLEQLFN